ncbi:MAG: BCCT family transporter [Halioglobus sp.]
MTLWLSAGLLLSFAAVLFILFRWPTLVCIGVTPVPTLTFIAILFTSGLDVGLIMFPLTEFAGYADHVVNPEYGFTNPLAIEFGFWAFLNWTFYFLTCFYFCIIEPRVRFFEIRQVKLLNNLVIIGTCAFTAYLLLVNLPWYLPEWGDGESVLPAFYVIVFAAIAFAVHSSSQIKYVRILSLASTALFFLLIASMWCIAYLSDAGSPADFFSMLALLFDYFFHLDTFALPINDYHEFYLYWWFAWSIMIGQFTARFVGGLTTWQLLIAMMVVPSIAIGTWFTVLYSLHEQAQALSSVVTLSMICVGILMVVNSLDSLIRLYTDNLNTTVLRYGYWRYFIANFVTLVGLTLLFQLDFLKIQWVGALVIALYFACTSYMLLKRRSDVFSIAASPLENTLDFDRINRNEPI